VNGVGSVPFSSKRANVNQQFAHVVQHSARDHSARQISESRPNPKTRIAGSSFAFAAADDDASPRARVSPETRPCESFPFQARTEQRVIWRGGFSSALTANAVLTPVRAEFQPTRTVGVAMCRLVRRGFDGIGMRSPTRARNDKRPASTHTRNCRAAAGVNSKATRWSNVPPASRWPCIPKTAGRRWHVAPLQRTSIASKVNAPRRVALGLTVKISVLDNQRARSAHARFGWQIISK